MTLDKVTIVVSKARDGVSDYVQVMSGDMLVLNIVIVAGAIEVQDHRPARKTPKKKGRAS